MGHRCLRERKCAYTHWFSIFEADKFIFSNRKEAFSGLDVS